MNVRPHLSVEVGEDAAVVETGERHMEVRVENAIVGIHGSLDERRVLVAAMAVAVGLDVYERAGDAS